MWSHWNYFRNIVSLLVNFLVCVLYRFSTYPRSNLLMVFLHCFQTPSHPNAEPQGVLCGGVWTLRSHDCKMLCSSLLNYTCQSPIDCPFVCLSSVPGSAAIIPLWIRRLLILRQWNVIPWLSFFYFSIYFFHLVWEITFCLEMIYKHSLCSDTLRTSNCTCHTCVTTEQHLDSAFDSHCCRCT